MIFKIVWKFSYAEPNKTMLPFHPWFQSRVDKNFGVVMDLIKWEGLYMTFSHI
jgi:hypothetical protein